MWSSLYIAYFHILLKNVCFGTVRPDFCR
jgi:hypothetical protein